MNWSTVIGTAAKRDGYGLSYEPCLFEIPPASIVKWFGTSTDIDLQKRVEADLRQANQDLEQFAYSASHDLKEPLRNIVIYGELLKKGHSQQFDEEGREFVRQMSEGAKRISALLADLLAYTQAATLTTEVQSANCAAIFEQVIRDLAREIKQSGALITNGELPVVAVNAVHVRQLFQNLIGNALKYRKDSESPKIHLTAFRERSFGTSLSKIMGSVLNRSITKGSSDCSSGSMDDTASTVEPESALQFARRSWSVMAAVYGSTRN